MQLRLDAADRLVELVEERRGPVYAEEAARRLFALRHAPVGLARSLLEEVVGDDTRLAWRGDSVGLADPPGAHVLIEDATFVVVDLETTGLRPGTSRICEIGAVRVRDFELAEEFELLVDPGVPLGAAISALTGLHDSELRGQPHPSIAVRRFLEFAGDAVLVAHNARFDLAFIDRETERLTGGRLAGPVVDTVGLARRLPLPRSSRPGVVRGSRTRPAGAAALVLPLGSTTARGGGGVVRARANRVAPHGVGGRGRARGTAAPPRAATCRKRAQRATRSLRLPAAARRQARLHADTDASRPDPQPHSRAPCMPRARRSLRGGARAPRARAAPPACAPPPPSRLPALRGCSPPA